MAPGSLYLDLDKSPGSLYLYLDLDKSPNHQDKRSEEARAV